MPETRDGGDRAPRVFDMHFHLDFTDDPLAYARDLGAGGVGALAVSCEPEGYRRSVPAQAPWLVPALGLHPWWVADGRVGGDELEDFERLAPAARAFGELGLDFDERHAPASSHGAQLAAFERACAAADASARQSGVRKPLSLHAFKAADAVLDVLERTGCLESCSCIFHWFAGSQPELERAREVGCWFSVNERCMRSRRWHQYARLVPAGRLLLETDLPPEPGARLSAGEQAASLGRCAAVLEELLGCDMAAQMARNARELLGA